MTPKAAMTVRSGMTSRNKGTELPIDTRARTRSPLMLARISLDVLVPVGDPLVSPNLSPATWTAKRPDENRGHDPDFGVMG